MNQSGQKVDKKDKATQIKYQFSLLLTKLNFNFGAKMKLIKKSADILLNKKSFTVLARKFKTKCISF